MVKDTTRSGAPEERKTSQADWLGAFMLLSRKKSLFSIDYVASLFATKNVFPP
jgi:hypothetical protein